LAGPAGGAHSAPAALQQGGGTERDGVREGREGKGKKWKEGRIEGKGEGGTCSITLGG